MNATNIHPDLAEIALEKAEGSAFEGFAKDFLSALEGRDFIPLGGVKDGGADGLYDYGNSRSYYQITRQENHRDKIRKTAKRLLEFGRNPSTIVYISSRYIPHIDKEEDFLTEELNLIIKIRDRKYIISHINDSKGTIAAYNNHLAVFTQFLASINRASDSFPSSHVSDPAAFVFLQHEVTNRLGNRKLIHSLTDSMILWALSDTDPDKGILMSEKEIRDLIFTEFPWTTKVLKGHIRQRLEEMRTKDNSGREVRWYKKEMKYCLPYETRSIIQHENQTDELLQIKFTEELKLLASELFDGDDGYYQLIAELGLRVVHTVFEKQGLLFSEFISSNGVEEAPPVVSDCIDSALEQKNISPEQKEQYRDYLETILRKVFYHGTPKQREYLSNLSRTYVLLFTLQAEPKVIEYFSTMSATFRLYLGSDILVKALSERYLSTEDQVARNLLRMANEAGITMYLSECVLEEIYTHIRGTYYEFKNYFADVEPYITREIYRNSNKILIRAYFYAKSEGKVKGWKTFLDQFLTYSNIEKSEGRDELRKYLIAEYKLTYTENEELESVAKATDVGFLAKDLLENDQKENEALAYNTALLVHGIYGLRKKYNETSGVSEYGLRTWWMTNQTRVLKYTVNIIRSKRSQYIMRPEYILNFIAMSPTCEQVRATFKNIFPSVFGIQLGHRLKDGAFHQVMTEVRTWKDYEPGRITTCMSDLSDKLKSDRLKRYPRTLQDESE